MNTAAMCHKKKIQTPQQDVRKESKPCKSKRVDKTKATKKSKGCHFWLKRLFRCARPCWLLRCWRNRNKVAPTPVNRTQHGGKPNSRFKQKSYNPLKPIIKKTALAHRGLPNIGNSCYLNATLQGLMTLHQFMMIVRAQRSVWRASSEAQLLRHLQAITDARTSTGIDRRTILLKTFKNTVASNAPEFRGSNQRDAHEFLTALLDQIQSLAPTLRALASRMGTTYICPVQEVLTFRMEVIRRCRTCGMGSSRREVFTNLSLDIIPGGSIQLLLNHYLRETELEYRCECGGTISRQRSTFASLPNVLILHMKRFRYSPSHRLEKEQSSIHINRDVVVSSNEGDGCFSLVGVVSHLGYSADHGHYICDGLHPEDCPQKPTDDWLTYNDSCVWKATGDEVCRNRQSAAYMLFYQRLRRHEWH